MIVLAVAAGLLAAGFALAQELDVGLEYGEAIGLGNTDPRIIIANIIRFALGFLGIIAVALAMYAGWLWITSAGEAEKIDKAKKLLTAAVIGLMIIMSSFAIASFILNRLIEATGGGGPGGGPGGGVPPGGGSPSAPVSCDGNTLTPACDADSVMCAAGYYCHPDSCLCQPGGNYGDPCDGNSNTAACDADDGLCSAYLACNADAGCVCLGGPVIEDVSPIGGFCNGDINTFCQDDEDCAAFAPSTCNNSSPRGAVGNLVTISGRYFGNYEDGVSKVYFWNGSDFIEAALAADVNPECDNSWTDSQVIAVVPAGIAQGAIKIVAGNGEDTTDNEVGPGLPDFVVNNISSPGICRLDPAQGVLGETVNYLGVNLTGGTAYFGDYKNYVAALDASFPAPLSGTARVPNIKTGKTTSFIVGSGGASSNYLGFTKAAEAEQGPYVTAFEPQAGAAGQYVSIYGGGFGSVRGDFNHVYFDNGATLTEADYEFPAVCADSVWLDNQAIVKVPADLADGSYTLVMELGDTTIDTEDLTPSYFNVNNNLSLAPSLCALEPVMGPKNSEVSLWGEYFGEQDANSKVRFYYYKDQGGDAVSFWGIDPEAAGGEQVYKAVTTVHSGAETGPVRVVKSSPELAGNGINFNVGLCTAASDSDAACGDWICCPDGSAEAGKCQATIDECYVSFISSVYEWDFSTGGEQAGPGEACYDLATAAGCNPNNPPCAENYYCDPNSCTCQVKSELFDSCRGYSLDVGSCDPIFCPNSPGQCSPYAGGGVIGTGVSCGDENCAGIGACADGSCQYSPVLDKCFLSGAECNFSASDLTADILGEPIEAYCALYNGAGRWYIDTPLSCPTGWTKLPDDKCVNENLSCNLCADGFICQDDQDGDGEGICAVEQDICPAGSVCGEDGECIVDKAAGCECCCEIGQDARDCCAPLTCGGICGSDTLDDGAGFGYCSGCAQAGTTQAEKDEACNCFGSSGKYCDTEIDAAGACLDCAQLSTPEQCSLHSDSCCFDAMSDRCRGLNGNETTLEQAGLAYCAYYNCQSEEPYGCDTTPVISGSFRKLTDCQTKCQAGGVSAGSSCYDDNFNTCAKDCAAGYICMGEDGCSSASPGFNCQAGDESCLCCCDPADDTCSEVETGDPLVDLVCQSNTAPCTGESRGMCCGCESDSNCGSINNIGCGSDACCRARPNVEATSPVDGAESVCRNTLITATFDQRMDGGSFSGKVILVGDYGSDVCPAGTEYLAAGNGSRAATNVFVRFYRKTLTVFKKLLTLALGDKAWALMAPVAPDHNYCALSGTVKGSQGADDKTILTFAPSKLLAGNRTYYVIIAGDENLDSNQGVLSSWGIGMAGPDTEIFNGITYTNAKIFSFKTLSDQGGNGGVCAIDHAEIIPSPYLFQTTTNNLNGENDSNFNDNTFDAVKDSDKVFTARAISADGQYLTPVDGYAWQWSWSVDNPLVVDLVTVAGLDNSRRLVRAQEGITNSKTYLRATVELTEDDYSTAGNGETGLAEIWVFLCANPWPPVQASGLWEPWRDSGNNCTIIDGGCYATNYELYYCRDANSAGTADDLPAILSDSTITRGYSSVQNIIKESYFFREDLPDISGISLVAVDPPPAAGKKAALYWSDVTVPAGEEFKEYTIYYGTSPGSYSASITTTGYGLYNTPANPFEITGLNNGKIYYFAITAKYVSGAESDYSNEVSSMPYDSEGPAVPVITAANPLSEAAEIVWTGDDEALGGYKIYYGVDTAPAGQFGDAIAIPYGLSGATTVYNLAGGVSYRFGMVAYDVYGNPSATSTIVTTTPVTSQE